jgi:hypothetical protein
MTEVNSDLVVTANVKRKQILLDMLPILLRMQSIIDIKSRLQSTIDEGNYAKALRMCSECLVVIDACKVRCIKRGCSSSVCRLLAASLL